MKRVKLQVSRPTAPNEGGRRMAKLRHRSYDRPLKADKRLRTAPRGAHTARYATITCREATHRPAPHRGHPRRGGGRGRAGVRPRPPGTGRTDRHGQPVLHFQGRRGSPRNDARRPSEILVKPTRRKQVNGTPPSSTESKIEKLGCRIAEGRSGPPLAHVIGACNPLCLLH